MFWSGSGTLVAIASEDSYYVLRFDRDAYNEKIEAGADLGDEGVEEAFDLIAEISERYVFHFSIKTATNVLPSAFKPVDGSGIASFILHPPTS